MLIYPAVDLQNGACVRLAQGRFDQAVRYADDPAARLAVFDEAGATWAHVVDLDGAQARAPRQHRLIGELAAGSRLRLQAGGGVRERAHVQALLDAGAARVVVGSLAAREPETVAAWLGDFGPERLTVALDIRGGDDGLEVAVDGWAEGSGLRLDDLLARLVPAGLRHVLVTDIARDGMLTGPNHALTGGVVRDWPTLQVQASGGVASLDDLSALRTTGAAGAIVGKALYEGRFTLAEALARAG